MAAKTALLIRHTPAEGIAGFRAPIEDAGYVIERVESGDVGFADLDFVSPDLVVTMGGPMGVYEAADYPWITTELAGLRARLKAERPTLGVCLGAQMVAAALGQPVFPGPVREVGYAPLTLSTVGMDSPLRHLEGVPVLHWHGDTFDLPSDVELLAASELYSHQAFARDNWLLGLQCHAEMGEDPRLEAWLLNRDYVLSAGTTPEVILDDNARFGRAAVAAGRAMIGEWLEGL